MTCHVSNQIAIHCDEPEQECASEIFYSMERLNHAFINGEFYFYDDITELIDSDEYENADENELRKLYIDKIAELME